MIGRSHLFYSTVLSKSKMDGLYCLSQTWVRFRSPTSCAGVAPGPPALVGCRSFGCCGSEPGSPDDAGY